MRILLSSVGRRGYLVKYFKQAAGNDDQVWGADSNRYTPAFQYCDRSVILPEVNEPDYIDKLIGLCKDNHIDIVVPLIDPELEILAMWHQRFENENIMVVVSPLETIETAFDKYLTYQFGKEKGIAVPQTLISVEEAAKLLEEGALKWPVLVKPRKGSASANITMCYNLSQLRYAFENCPQPMIQEFITGEEYGYDLFCDRDFRPVTVFCKRKLLMRAGETDKAISTDNPNLIEFGLKVAQNLKIFGPADLDVMMNKDGPKLLEINPRFGGGYPCAHLAGTNFPAKLIAIRQGRSLQPDTGSYPAGILMLKQDEIISKIPDNLQL